MTCCRRALIPPVGSATRTAEPPDSDVEPLPRAHAHGDCAHERPLADALAHGFTGVEADVWLVDGEIRVAHDLQDARPGATLQSLYLDPLAERLARCGDSVYPGWTGSLQLLVDIKSDAAATYAAVEDALRRYPRLVTRWTDGRTRQRAVTAVISGNRPLADLAAKHTRFTGYDGRLADLVAGLTAALMPMVSDDWRRHFSWAGLGPMPAAEKQKLRALAAAARAGGHRLRFWATPDAPGAERAAVWAELVAAGIDWISTDDLGGLRTFLRGHHRRGEDAA